MLVICEVGLPSGRHHKTLPLSPSPPQLKKKKKMLAEHIQSPTVTQSTTEEIVLEVRKFLLVYTDLSLPLGNKYVNAFTALCVIKYPSRQRGKLSAALLLPYPDYMQK